MAREMGVALDGARGSGPGGRVALADLEPLRAQGTAPVTTALATARPTSPLATATLLPPEVRPLSMMRKTIARRLTESKQTVPHFYLSIDVDADALVDLRERINQELANASPPHTSAADAEGGRPHEKVSINDLLVKACSVALTRVPECNAQFAGDSIHVFRRIDISVAVAVADGLVTPVVRNCDMKSVVAIAREVRDMAARARSKKLSYDEMTNGTFSISNLGMFGIDGFSAVINPPEGAILAVGRVRDEPVARDGQIVAGKKLALTLSCDHRVIDGAVGAAFLAELRALIEHPMRVLTG
jgi:pyruvate dehydrogenase E2 component (dihydrolipoamide acetyltransferase)